MLSMVWGIEYDRPTDKPLDCLTMRARLRIC
jgi:hypothetical protein